MASPRETNQAIAKALTGPALGATKVTLARLPDLLPVPVFLDSRSLDTAGIDRETILEFPQSPSTLEQQLSQTLLAAGLDWYTTQTVLVIGSERAIARIGETGLYRIPTQGNPSAIIFRIQQQVAPESWNIRGGPGYIGNIYETFFVAQSPKIHRQITTALRIRPLPHKYVHALDSVGVSISVVDGTLQDVLDQVRDQTKIPVEPSPDWSETNLLDSRISVKLNGISAKDTLDLLLSQIDCAWQIDGGKVQIDSRENATRNLVEKRLSLSNIPRHLSGRVRHIVPNCIAPGSWNIHGGKAEFETLRPGFFSVKQSRPAMRDLEQLMADLKTVRL